MSKKETDIKQTSMVTFDEVRDRIVLLRGQQVILDYAFAELYGVETREINQAVKNNPRKFPEGWMFELDNQESAALRSKNLILEKMEKESIPSITIRLSPNEDCICWRQFLKERAQQTRR